MLSTYEIYKLRVFLRNKKGALRKFGKPHNVVFHPEQARVVGVIVKRPDALLMVKRKERFVAFDRLEFIENGIEIVDAPDSWDKAACKRLGIDLDTCLLWDLMPVKSVSGRELGEISSVAFDEDTLKVDHIDISNSGIDRAILGAATIGADRIIGYRDGAIVVSDNVGSVEEEGGMAAAAGEAWAKAKHEAGQAGKKAAEKTEEAVNAGAYKVGEAVGAARKKMNDAADAHEAKKREAAARGERTGVDKAANELGKQLGRASRMFADFKDEFDKASKGE